MEYKKLQHNIVIFLHAKFLQALVDWLTHSGMITGSLIRNESSWRRHHMERHKRNYSKLIDLVIQIELSVEPMTLSKMLQNMNKCINWWN